MNRATLTTKESAPNDGIRSEIRHTPAITQGAWKTEPLAHLQCAPATKYPSEITWKPVYLPLMERLAELRWLPEDLKWPGAALPAEQAFRDAVSFTERLPVSLVATPHISLADDGEVNFSWSTNGMRIDLGFYGTGAFSYYARDKDGNELFGDDVSVTSFLPSQLVELMTR